MRHYTRWTSGFELSIHVAANIYNKIIFLYVFLQYKRKILHIFTYDEIHIPFNAYPAISHVTHCAMSYNVIF